MAESQAAVVVAAAAELMGWCTWQYYLRQVSATRQSQTTMVKITRKIRQ